MINIDSRNNQISIIQGDTGVIDFMVDNYQLSEGDVVYFTVIDKDLPRGSEPVIKKKITENLKSQQRKFQNQKLLEKWMRI